MPTTVNHKRTSSTPRKSVGGRKKGRKVGSERRQPAPPANAIIADSFHSLIVQQKRGVEVFFALNKKEIDTSEMEQVLTVCWDAYSRACKLLRNEDVGCRRNNIPLSMSLFIALDGLQKMMPNGWQVNIDLNDSTGTYSVNVYQECRWNMHHHYLTVGPTLLSLQKLNPSLHDLFVSFIRQLQAHGIDLWYQGMMGSDMEMMEDRICDMESEDSDVAVYRADLEEYKTGQPAKYQKLFNKAKLVPLQELQKRANRFKAGEPISNLIYQGCEVLKEGYHLRDFGYYLIEDLIDTCFIDLDSQINILWNTEDSLCADYSDTLDAMSQEGIQLPTVYLELSRNTQRLDFEELNKKASWPLRLTEFFVRAETLIKQFTSELKN